MKLEAGGLKQALKHEINIRCKKDKPKQLQEHKIKSVSLMIY